MTTSFVAQFDADWQEDEDHEFMKMIRSLPRKSKMEIAVVVARNISAQRAVSR